MSIVNAGLLESQLTLTALEAPENVDVIIDLVLGHPVRWRKILAKRLGVPPPHGALRIFSYGLFCRQ